MTQTNALTRAYLAMSNNVISVGEDLKRVIDRQDKMMDRQDKLERLLPQLVDAKKGDDEERLTYSDFVSTYQPKTPARLFVTFFNESLPALYYNQLKMSKRKGLSQKKRGKVSTCFRRQKKCMRYMLCCLASYPSTPPPHNVGKPYADRLKKINLQAEAAERGLLHYWNKKSKKNAERLTFSMIGSFELEDLEARFVEQPPDGIT